MKMNILSVVVLVLCLKTVVGNQDSFEQSESFDFPRANSTQEGKNATWTYFVNENNGTISEEESENNGTYNEYQPEEKNASWTHTIEENNGTISEDNSDYNSTFYEIQLERNDTVTDQIVQRCETKIDTLCQLITTFEQSICDSPKVRELCPENCKVDCEWSEWKIGECSKQCGGGRRINKREQNVLAAHGGRECSGPTELDEPCNTHECPVDEIVITTGYNGGRLSDTEVMKIDHTGLFESKRCPSMEYPIAVSGAAGAYLPESNTNIICGGYNNTGHTNRCFQFNASYMSWDEVNSLNIPRSYHAMTTIGQNVVTRGGWTSGGLSSSSCEKLSNGVWKLIQPLPNKLAHFTCMVTIDSSTILILGGTDESIRVRKKLR